MNNLASWLLTFATIIIPVFATIYTGYIRIRNENREEHKPYLALGEIQKLPSINRFAYFFIILGKKYQGKKKQDILVDSKKEDNIFLSLAFKNIGYGVASNIKLFDLYTGEAVLGVQERSESMNQKRSTTFDISKDTEKSVQTCILVTRENGIIQPEQHCILCVYQDLNQNIYSFIIGIDVKAGGAYDFFAYQRSSHSYSSLVSQNKKHYKAIMKKYKK